MEATPSTKYFCKIKNTISTGINDNTEPTPEEIVEIQAKEIVQLNEALESHSAEVTRLKAEVARLIDEKESLSRQKMTLYESLSKINEALNNNDESDEDKNIILRWFNKIFK